MTIVSLLLVISCAGGGSPKETSQSTLSTPTKSTPSPSEPARYIDKVYD